MPRFHNTKKFKGFAFVEYMNGMLSVQGVHLANCAAESSVPDAVKRFNRWDPHKAPQSFRVMPKAEWVALKQVYKKAVVAEQRRTAGVGGGPEDGKGTSTNTSHGLIHGPC